jgi:hypothetical protein
MFMALGATSEAEVLETLNSLNLGGSFNIDRVEVTEGHKAGMAKFFVHYADMTSVSLRTELNDFAQRKADGEMDVRPKRIVFGRNRDGRDMYWQIFKCDTPAERESKGKATEFKPRVE